MPLVSVTQIQVGPSKNIYRVIRAVVRGVKRDAIWAERRNIYGFDGSQALFCSSSGLTYVGGEVESWKVKVSCWREFGDTAGETS